MRRTRNRIERRSSWSLGVLAVLLVLAIASPASAEKPIVVSAADPDMGEQGTLGLEVMVSGENFPSDAWADFFVTGTTDPGGITVKNVKRQGPKSLKVTIDIDEAAQTELKFDIQVRSRGNGRSGKGTELFGVVQKSNGGQDTTPPGEPTNLVVLEEKYGTVELSFTMPADDGYDLSSGPVQRCQVRGGSWDSQDCLDDWVGPGATQACRVGTLDPDTAYTLRVACVDEADNWSSEGSVAVSTRPFSEFKSPNWSIVEVPVDLDGLMGHGFDLEGNVVIAGMLGLWDEQSTKGKPKPLPMVIRIITGVWDGSEWSWTFEDVPGFANRLLMDPWGRPAFAGEIFPDLKAHEADVFFLSQDGVDWVKEVVATEARYYARPSGIAFHPISGEPLLAWCGEGSPAGVRLAQRDSAGVWSVETISSGCRGDGLGSQAEISFDASGNPVVVYQDGLSDNGPYEVRLLTKSGSIWTEEVVTTRPAWPRPGYLPRIVYEWGSGNPTIAMEGENWMMKTCDRTLAGWQCDDRAFSGGIWDGSSPSPILGGLEYLTSKWFGQDSSGELFIAFSTEADFDATLARRSPGQSTWTLEHVDHPSEHGLPPNSVRKGGYEWKEGPFLALDATGLPTLSYLWSVGESYGSARSHYPPSEYHLFFAWKTTP